ncbi:unnamed protein product [Eretmochelys imbricata]
MTNLPRDAPHSSPTPSSSDNPASKHAAPGVLTSPPGAAALGRAAQEELRTPPHTHACWASAHSLGRTQEQPGRSAGEQSWDGERRGDLGGGGSRKGERSAREGGCGGSQISRQEVGDAWGKGLLPTHSEQRGPAVCPETLRVGRVGLRPMGEKAAGAPPGESAMGKAGAAEEGSNWVEQRVVGYGRAPRGWDTFQVSGKTRMCLSE